MVPSFADLYLTMVSTASDRSKLIFTIKFSRSHLGGKNYPRETKKQDCLYWHLRDTIRMRQEPCVYLRARLLVVPEACFAARPFCSIPGGNHFRPSLDPRRLSRRRAFGEYGSALTILPSEPPRVSTGMIYAAAFHIFHCFQVFGSICKIKFVMREHPAPSLSRPRFLSRASRRHPRTPSSPPFAARARVDAYGRPVNFLAC